MIYFLHFSALQARDDAIKPETLHAGRLAQFMKSQLYQNRTRADCLAEKLHFLPGEQHEQHIPAAMISNEYFQRVISHNQTPKRITNYA